VKESSVPASRLGRLGHFGRLAGGLAGGMVSEGLRRLASGERPSRQDLLLNSGNIQRVSDRLAELRGAAMKVGQLLSMEAGDFLPPEFTAILARLRDSADVMPLGEVARVLKHAWGPGWESRFRRFDFKPMAAASIGQVHRAETRDGRTLAIKIQYPGVKASIDSDVDNVAALLRLFGLLPPGIDVAPLLAEARRQLHEEADYAREATQLERYRLQLGERSEFAVPTPIDEWLTADVLPMTYLPGVPIDSLDRAPAELRNRVAALLVELALTEVLQWGLVQTDANFANFRYDDATGRIGLLDFGAMRDYSEPEVLALRTLLSAACLGDTARVAAAACDVGYITAGDPQAYRTVINELVTMAAEPARFDGAYDFGTSDLAQRMTEKVLALRVEQRFARLPPPAILFLHRKIAGTYLLCARLKARVEIAPLLDRALTECVSPSPDQMRRGGPESLGLAG
jgi:predicted unusual protein kinase regulating ubiquinone biosynthesis (AarF/ABC1/UbiB family)